MKNDEKVANNVSLRMNLSKMPDMKIIKDLKKLEELKKGLKVYSGICKLFEKESFEEMLSSSNCFLFFEAKYKCRRIVYWFFEKYLAILRKESSEES